MDKPRLLVIATRNRGKLSEIKKMLQLEGWEIVDLNNFPDIGDIPEEGASFEENAILKARTVAELTGLPVMADDSGLEVEALDDRPGVHSARFAGEGATDDDNNRKLLEMMNGVSAAKRGARFVCVMAFISPGGEERVVRGKCEGVILDEHRGEGGFGYDPLFYHRPSGKTFSEMTPDEKNSVSHRSRALLKLRNILPRLLEEGS